MWGAGVQIPYMDHMGVCFWKSLRKGYDTFHRFVSFKVRDGHSIKFLHHSGVGTLLYRRISLSCMALHINKEASVVDLISFSGDSYHISCSYRYV